MFFYNVTTLLPYIGFEVSDWSVIAQGVAQNEFVISIVSDGQTQHITAVFEGGADEQNKALLGAISKIQKAVSAGDTVFDCSSITSYIQTVLKFKLGDGKPRRKQVVLKKREGMPE